MYRKPLLFVRVGGSYNSGVILSNKRRNTNILQSRQYFKVQQSYFHKPSSQQHSNVTPSSTSSPTPPEPPATPAHQSTLSQPHTLLPQKGPLIFEISPFELSRLSEEKSTLVLQIKKLLEKETFQWIDFPIVLPESKLSALKQNQINLSEVFNPQVVTTEVQNLSVGLNGERIEFTEEQLKDIRKTATFTVKSKMFVGIDHVWQLSKLLQKGSKNIGETYKNSIFSSLEHIVMGIPNRLKRDEFIDLVEGWKFFKEGLKDIPDLLIGLRKIQPKYSNNHISRDIDKKRKTFIMKSLIQIAPDVYQVRQDQQEELLKSEGAGAGAGVGAGAGSGAEAGEQIKQDEIATTRPSRSDTTNTDTKTATPPSPPLTLDFRLGTLLADVEVRHTLETIEKEAQMAWDERGRLRFVYYTLRSYKRQNVDPILIPKKLAEDMVHEQNKRLLLLLKNSKRLAKFDPALGTLVCDILRTIYIFQEVASEKMNQNAKKKEEIRDYLKKISYQIKYKILVRQQNQRVI